jgi:hypothetical protein
MHTPLLPDCHRISAVSCSPMLPSVPRARREVNRSSRGAGGQLQLTTSVRWVRAERVKTVSLGLGNRRSILLSYGTTTGRTHSATGDYTIQLVPCHRGKSRPLLPWPQPFVPLTRIVEAFSEAQTSCRLAQSGSRDNERNEVPDTQRRRAIFLNPQTTLRAMCTRRSRSAPRRTRRGRR